MIKRKKNLCVNTKKDIGMKSTGIGANKCLFKNFIPFSVKNNTNHSIISIIENPEVKNRKMDRNKKTKALMYFTPKNSAKAFNALFSQLAIDNKKEEHNNNNNNNEAIQKLIPIVLPDQFQNLLLEPCEYQMRYNPVYLVEYSLDIFSYLEIKQV